FARGDLPVREDEVEAEEEAEHGERRRVIGERRDEVFYGAVVPSLDLLVAHREDVREEPRRADGFGDREIEREGDLDGEARHAMELGGDRDGLHAMRVVRLEETELGDVACTNEADGAVLTDAPEDVAEGALVA